MFIPHGQHGFKNLAFFAQRFAAPSDMDSNEPHVAALTSEVDTTEIIERFLVLQQTTGLFSGFDEVPFAIACSFDGPTQHARARAQAHTHAHPHFPAPPLYILAPANHS